MSAPRHADVTILEHSVAAAGPEPRACGDDGHRRCLAAMIISGLSGVLDGRFDIVVDAGRSLMNRRTCLCPRTSPARGS